MKSIRNIIRPVAVALVLAISAAPLTAFAGNKEQAAEVKKDKHFPMTAESFNKHIEARITHSRERFTKMLAAKKVTEAQQAEMKKKFEERAAAIRAAATRVSADGSVTKAEAKEVRALSKGLRQKGHGKGAGKGRKDRKNDNVG